MPVAPYGSEEYREWNRDRMRRKRSELDSKYAEYDRDYHRVYDGTVAGTLAAVRSNAKRRGNR